MFWSKCLDGVFIRVLVAQLHVKFCTINAPSRHCVFHSVSVECFGPFFFSIWEVIWFLQTWPQNKIVVSRFHYINTFKELNGIRTDNW